MYAVGSTVDGRVEKHTGDREAAQKSAMAESYEYPETGGTKERTVEPDLLSQVNPENQAMWQTYLVGARI